jgi:anti-sigma B factor antagonist
MFAGILAEDLPSRLVVDLSDLVYLDSTGLSVFVTVQKRASAAGIDFRLSNPNPSVRRLFQITALDQFFMLDGDGASEPAGVDDQGHGGGFPERE